jgi:hypothetical protein
VVRERRHAGVQDGLILPDRILPDAARPDLGDSVDAYDAVEPRHDGWLLTFGPETRSA